MPYDKLNKTSDTMQHFIAQYHPFLWLMNQSNLKTNYQYDASNTLYKFENFYAKKISVLNFCVKIYATFN